MIAVLGWFGSALVVGSLIQRDVRRLRQLNLAAAVALGIFNVVLGIWSMIVLNVALATVNSFHLLRERRSAGSAASLRRPEQLVGTSDSSLVADERPRTLDLAHRGDLGRS